jgi:hypothetical protein
MYNNVIFVERIAPFANLMLGEENTVGAWSMQGLHLLWFFAWLRKKNHEHVIS